MPVFVERSVLALEAIYVNGGRRGFLLRIAPAALQRTLDAVAVEVALEA
jgi:prolyl-tRNA editing enzyme YbaK/EbsC (Cys-tRNA(Pro) deacylase)